jgi:hypothetical protein
MPRVRSLKPPKKPNYLAATLREYKRLSGLTSEDIAKELGCSPVNVRAQIGKSADLWTIGKLRKYCAIIGAPFEEVLRAAAR